MPNVILLPQTGIETNGTGQYIGPTVSEVNLQFTPQKNIGFTGTVTIQSSTSPNPGDGDWFPIATLNFSAHTSIVDINLYVSNNPWLRAQTTATAFGSISVYLAAS